jgi:nucleotide-binding universal stress UspA family protein
MFKRLLVPLDGSDIAAVAAIYAQSIPSERVCLLTVLSDEDAGIGFAPAGVQEEWRQEWRDAVCARLAGIAEPLELEGRDVEIEVVFGRPAEWIETYARDADLIIMTTHGRGAGERLVLGSVADRVARTSPAPVMLIRGGEDPVAAQAIVRLVVGLDGSDLAEQALPFVQQLAMNLNVPVLLTRVVDIEQALVAAQRATIPVARFAGTPELIREGIDDYLQSEAAPLIDAGVDVETAVIEGEPAPALNAALLPGDVLVLTSHGRGGLGRWMLGSVTEKLVRQGHTPVIVIRSQPSSES